MIKEKTRELQGKDKELQEKGRIIDKKTQELYTGKRREDRKGYQRKDSRTTSKG